jgi:hypothetical protein
MHQRIPYLKIVALTFLFTLLGAVVGRPEFSAARLTLSWIDNSTNEAGFRIERKTGSSGTYAEIAVLAANVVSYIDNNLSNATHYCYRLRAYNSTGTSGYSNEQCAKTSSMPPPPPPKSFLLNVTKAGTGSGTVTATGINCGNDCRENYRNGSSIALTATPAKGSTFAGWIGKACSSGTIIITRNMGCTAAFDLGFFTLKVTKIGTGSGTVTGMGINCGSDCSEIISSGAHTVLTAAAAPGATFSGWKGAGCTSGIVKVTADTTCTATFSSATSLRDRIGIYRPSTGEWFLDADGDYAWDSRIDVMVRTFAATGSRPVVGDWNGMGDTQLGLFQASTRQWHLDLNADRAIDDCEIDACEGPFGEAKDIAIAGKWNRRGNHRIGVFRPSTGYWYLDRDADGKLDGCGRDGCVFLKNYMIGDAPLVGDWSGAGISHLGLFRPSTGQWFLDRNGNRSWDDCRRDRCIESFGRVGDLPITGDWAGTGRSHIGVWRPSTGQWFLDYDGNGMWNGCAVDLCVAAFGIVGDIPVVGKW